MAFDSRSLLFYCPEYSRLVPCSDSQTSAQSINLINHYSNLTLHLHLQHTASALVPTHEICYIPTHLYTSRLYFSPLRIAAQRAQPTAPASIIILNLLILNHFPNSPLTSFSCLHFPPEALNTCRNIKAENGNR